MLKTGITNEALLDALNAMRENQNEDTENNYTEALLGTTFVVPVSYSEPPVQQADGSIVIPEGAQVRFVTFTDEDDQMVFPVFSDDDHMAQDDWDVEDTIYPYPMTIEQYLPMVFDEEISNMGGLVLNPFSEDGMPITKENMAFLANVIQSMNDDETQMEVSDADEIVPGPLKYDLVGFADDHGALIDHMYLLWLSQGDQGLYLVVIDGPDAQAAMELGPEIEKIFKADAGDEGAEFDLVMKDDFDVDLSEFTPIYDHNV